MSIVWQDLAAAMCLVLVIEGVMPFISPAKWRELMAGMAGLDDRQMRIMGLISMLVGIGLLSIIK